MKKLNSAQKFLIKSIETYQKNLSPDHSDWAKATNRPPYCKFFPTCSDYMKESIEKKWAIFGSLKGIWRICRCNPWTKWGLDFVEKDTEKKIKNERKI